MPTGGSECLLQTTLDPPQTSPTIILLRRPVHHRPFQSEPTALLATIIVPIPYPWLLPHPVDHTSPQVTQYVPTQPRSNNPHLNRPRPWPHLRSYLLPNRLPSSPSWLLPQTPHRSPSPLPCLPSGHRTRPGPTLASRPFLLEAMLRALTSLLHSHPRKPVLSQTRPRLPCPHSTATTLGPSTHPKACSSTLLFIPCSVLPSRQRKRL